VLSCTDDHATCGEPGIEEGCGGTVQCSAIASVGSCTCDATSHWACTPACADGLCSAAAVQHAIAGVWSGTVDPPSFADPYAVTLTITEDGRWSGTAPTMHDNSPFYYGDGGGRGANRIFVQAQTAVGGFATIRVFGGDIDGAMEAIHVDAHTLRFTFVDSWLSCTRRFSFDLHR
jgi:hypothetical protein